METGTAHLGVAPSPRSSRTLVSSGWPATDAPALLVTCAEVTSRFTGPTAKLEHVAERFSAFYTDLEQEKQVRAQTLQQQAAGMLVCPDLAQPTPSVC